MEGICKLCRSNTQLKESHFIPKFIGKWVKKTSITGYIRAADNVGKRAQDIAKEYWLCGDCEQLFSNWERQFANEIFYPFANSKISIANYDKWLAKFCASLSWRTLTYIRCKNQHDEKPKEYIALIEKAELHLRKFLLGVENNLNEYEQHIFPLEEIESTTDSGLPPNINRYFLRTMAMDIVGNSSNLFVYTKLPRFIVLGAVKATNLNKMRSSRIALGEGRMSPRNYYFPDGFRNYLLEKAQEVTDAYNQIPQNQLENFEKYIDQNPQKIVDSQLFEAFMHDYNMFGNKVFKVDDN